MPGYAMNGMGRVRNLLSSLNRCVKEEGVQPNDITFVCLLSACSHAGMVDEEGLCYYALMSSVHRISATLEHHSCNG